MLINKIVELGKELNEKKQALMKQVKEQLQPALLEVLNNNPNIIAIGWRQYTPYFNDGDTCEFSVHDVQWCDSEEMLEDSMWEWNYANDGPEDLQALADVINGNEDIMKEVFGDHVQVTVTREGVEVEGYDHE